MGLSLILILFNLFCLISSSYGYDSFDPKGNITVKWDIMDADESTYDVTVSIYNYQLVRHIELPGWKLSWGWTSNEVIWNMLGAEATLQGNCSAFKGKEMPHSCEKQPVIIDLLPGAPYNVQSFNCCKGGVLTSTAQNPSMSLASFKMSVGIGLNNMSNLVKPKSFSLGIPGYSCGMLVNVIPTKFGSVSGRRKTQALETWMLTCMYSQLRGAPIPTCCVSLSTFYNNKIVPCPRCSCGCQDQPGRKCVKPGDTPSLLQLRHSPEVEPPPLVRCSEHLCPIRVHWHVKESYTKYWRVKITVTNLNFMKNYSYWTMAVQHPNLQSLAQIFSFNSHPLDLHGPFNDLWMFWGLEYYNDMLLSTDNNGNVQSEILLHKDPGNFTFGDGWAFPRKISFNGDLCVMPPPDDFPSLPNSSHRTQVRYSVIFYLLLLTSMIYEL